MILKLIQAGGFTGKHKVAEEDLSQHPEALKDHVDEVFSGTEEAKAGASKAPPSAARDKENLFLEYDGKSLPLDAIKPNSQLKSVIEKLQSNLHYQK